MPELGYTFHEHGAYLMPLAFLPVVLSVRLVPGRWVLALPVLAIAATCYALTNPERESPDRAFGQTAARFLNSHDVRLVVGDFGEYEGAFETMLPNPANDAARERLLFINLVVFEARLNKTVTANALALYFHPSVTGRPSVITNKAMSQLRAAGGLFEQCADEVMPKVYEFEAVQFTGPDGAVLNGVQLNPRQ